MIGDECSPYLIDPCHLQPLAERNLLQKMVLWKPEGGRLVEGQPYCKATRGLLIFAAKSLTLEPCTQVLLTSHADGF